jgi:hypothetical protein
LYCPSGLPRHISSAGAANINVPRRRRCCPDLSQNSDRGHRKLAQHIVSGVIHIHDISCAGLQSSHDASNQKNGSASVQTFGLCPPSDSLHLFRKLEPTWPNQRVDAAVTTGELQAVKRATIRPGLSLTSPSFALESRASGYLCLAHGTLRPA